MEGEKPYHEWYGGYGWIGRFHTKLFSKMLFVVFFLPTKRLFFTQIDLKISCVALLAFLCFFSALKGLEPWSHGAGESSGGGICGRILSKKFVKGV